MRNRPLLTGWLLLLFLFLSGAAQAANPRKHIIYFTDKKGTPYDISSPGAFLSEKALERRQRQNIQVIERDLPVNPDYVRQVNALNGNVLYTSKWFNAAVVYCDSAVLSTLETLPFVKPGQAQTLSRTKAADTSAPATEVPMQDKALRKQQKNQSELNYGPSYNQANMLGAVQMHRMGFRGEGMTIAVFDGGFLNVDKLPGFSHLYESGRIKGTYNFHEKNADVYKYISHGTNVLSTMAAYMPGQLIGTAFKADYFLFITEVEKEHNIEEIYWLLAAEYADSAGVDIINSSLGYTEFDPPSRSYTTAELDGNTTLVTRAADFAAATGILVVNSAGNEGNTPWRKLGAPADGDSVLAVGAVDANGQKALFSSFGPSADGRIKPDVMAQGQKPYILYENGFVGPGDGTSFSAPILAGMAACLWQAAPNATNMEIINALRQSASFAHRPNNDYGYGIPNFMKASQLLNPDMKNLDKDETFIFPNPMRDGDKLTIQLEHDLAGEDVVISIYDAVGRLVYQEETAAAAIRNQIAVRTDYFQNGLYVCSIRGGNEHRVIRFLKY